MSNKEFTTKELLDIQKFVEQQRRRYWQNNLAQWQIKKLKEANFDFGKKEDYDY